MPKETRGSNIFGQWPCEDLAITNFTKLELSSNEEDHLRTIEINWSYNIISLNGSIQITGFYEEEDRKIAQLDDKGIAHISGNDRHIVFHQDSRKLKCMSLSNRSKVIELHRILSLAAHVDEAEINLCNLKVANDAVICLFKDNSLYSINLPHSYDFKENEILINKIDTVGVDGRITNIDAGYEHFILLTDTGKVYSWGNGRRCQLGHGDLENQDKPKEVEALSGLNVIKVAVGGWHNLALSVSGDLYTWGWNGSGQLGISEEQIKIQEDHYNSFSTGDNHASTAKETEEQIVVSGFKKASSQATPCLVEFIDESTGKQQELDVLDIGCGSRHSAVALSDACVWTTGLNNFGQLGFEPDQYPVSDLYKKAFTSDNKIINLKCGPWATLVETS